MTPPMPAAGALPAWEQEVRALEERNRRAFLAQDIAALRTLWSDDLLVNAPIDRVLAKEQVLDLLARGVIAHASFEVTVEVIARSGDLAVVMGREVVTDTPDGPARGRRFTNLWRAEGGSWRLVARHANLTGRL